MPFDFDPTGLYPREDRTGREEFIDFHGVAAKFAVNRMLSEDGKKCIPVFPRLSKRELLFLAKAAQFVMIEDPRSRPGEDLYTRLRPCSQANLEQLFYDFRAYEQLTSGSGIRAQVYHDAKSGLWSMLIA